MSALPISLEFKKKTDLMLEEISLNTLFDEQVLEQSAQEFIKITQQEVSSELLQKALLRAPLTMAQIKLLIIKLKQSQLIDSQLASLYCAALKEFDLAREQNSITQEKKEKLEIMVNLVKQKLENLISNKQIEPLLAKPLILLLPMINVYIKTLKII